MEKKSKIKNFTTWMLFIAVLGLVFFYMQFSVRNFSFKKGSEKIVYKEFYENGALKIIILENGKLKRYDEQGNLIYEGKVKQSFKDN